MRILFWGTPEFAVPSLRALSEEGHDVVGVVTRPDRPAGRGRELRASPIKREALDENIQILEPESARSESFGQPVTRRLRVSRASRTAARSTPSGRAASGERSG